MPFFEGFELIDYAINEELEEKLYMRWIAGYQQSISYEEFKHEIGVSSRQINDNRTAEMILQSVREIIGVIEYGNI